MHRQIVFNQQVPLETDLLNTNKYAMVALGWLAQGILGTGTLVTDVTCIANTPAALNVIVTPGQIFSLQNTDGSPYSSLAADTSHSIIKQGILADPAVLTITPPGTVGFSQNYLIQAVFQETDAGSTPLPYFNPSNPAVAWSGPANSGTPQFTVRQNNLSVTAKAGVAASSGSQTTPAPDAGYVGLFVVTVANGATTISTGNISKLATAPMLALNGQLPLVPTGVQNGTWVYANDTGAANALVVTLTPAPPAYIAGMGIRAKVANTNTGAATINLNGLGAKSIVRPDGSATQAGDFESNDIANLIYDGASFRMVALPRQAITRIAGAQKTHVVIDDTPGTRNFTVPADVFNLDVELWGASAGTYASTTTNPSGGAGGGGYSRKAISVTPGQVISYSVGAGGTQGTSGAAPTSGGTTSFGGVFSATGSTINGTATLTDPRVGGIGGLGSGGDLNIPGQYGRSCVLQTQGEGGGSSFGFYGASGPNSGAGSQGLGPGAGGTGAGNVNNTTASLGSTGVAGRVLIRY